MTQPVDIAISFDTTGSMYPALTQVRRHVGDLVRRLFRDLPDPSIGVTAHGDYCDARSTYVTRHQHLSREPQHIVEFVQRVARTNGGDAPECYELVLHEARSFLWRPGSKRVLVLIGDDVPHPPGDNPSRLNWRTEVDALTALGVTIYAVQALGRSYATTFYRELAERSGGYHLTLDQFATLTDLLLGIGYHQAGAGQLDQYVTEVQTGGRMNRELARSFGTMTGTAISYTETAPARRRAASMPSLDVLPLDPGSLDPVHPSRFQILAVDHTTDIKTFVTEQDLSFKVGRGFYEFTKPETIQPRKEVVLMRRDGSGDMFTGRAARALIGLPDGVSTRLRPITLEEYRVFVQSTSANRKLIGGTGFLYEVEDWDRSAT